MFSDFRKNRGDLCILNNYHALKACAHNSVSDYCNFDHSYDFSNRDEGDCKRMNDLEFCLTNVFFNCESKAAIKLTKMIFKNLREAFCQDITYEPEVTFVNEKPWSISITFWICVSFIVVIAVSMLIIYRHRVTLYRCLTLFLEQCQNCCCTQANGSTPETDDPTVPIPDRPETTREYLKLKKVPTSDRPDQVESCTTYGSSSETQKEMEDLNQSDQKC